MRLNPAHYVGTNWGSLYVSKLTDLRVRKAGPGIHGDGGGLYLRVKPSGAKSWVLRVQFNGVRQDVGLGGYPADRSLSEAREEAARLRKIARRGGNPYSVRDSEKVVVPDFAKAMISAHAELSKGWTEKNAAAFKSSLEQHIVPKLGRKRVDQIGATEIVAALAPIWTEKPHIAKKLRARTLRVLSFAKARGWREAALPDPRELRDGLASQPEARNYASMPYADAPAFYRELRGRGDTATLLALAFILLTAARSGEVRGARWDQFDLTAKTWSRPIDLMKSRKAHAVTLSGEAVSVLERAAKVFSNEGLVFPGSRRGSPLSDMTITKAFRSFGRAETVHGLRSTFRDWCAEQMPKTPYIVAEMALAHKVGNATEQAYLRSDLRALRFELMEAWAGYLTGVELP